MFQMLSPLIRSVEEVKEKWLSLKVTTKTTKNVAHKRDISATERSRVPLQCHLQLTQEQQSLERRP